MQDQSSSQFCGDCIRSSRTSSTPNYMEIMKQRWQQANSVIPEIDKIDIINETPFFNQGRIGKRHQHHPEYTQTSYLRLRSLEEAFAMSNYLDPKLSQQEDKEKLSLPKRMLNFASNFNRRHLNPSQQISHFDRSYAIQKIFDLHIKKDYKIETLFIACNILDRYLFTIGWENFPRD